MSQSSFSLAFWLCWKNNKGCRKKSDIEFAVISIEIVLCSSGDNQEDVTAAAVLSSDMSPPSPKSVVGDVIIQGMEFYDIAH